MRVMIGRGKSDCDGDGGDDCGGEDRRGGAKLVMEGR